MAAYLTVCLPAEHRVTRVTLYDTGDMYVELDGMKVARHELTGFVMVNHDGTVDVRAEDAYVNTPLSPFVVKAALNAALRQSRKARRAARQIATTKHPPVRYAPDTLEYMAMRALGKIRQDGWPYGKAPLE